MSTDTQNTAPAFPRYIVTDSPFARAFTSFRVIDTDTGERPEAAPFDFASESAARTAARQLNDTGALVAAILAALKVTEAALEHGATGGRTAHEQVEDILRGVLPE